MSPKGFESEAAKLAGARLTPKKSICFAHDSIIIKLYHIII